jgi:hypothetical protein
MYNGKSISVEELQIAGRYQLVRKRLLSDCYSAHREQPLAYWAIPTDRRLPIAFMGRTLGELLDTPFKTLAGTPGIGEKKIRVYLQLLDRVLKTEESELPNADLLWEDFDRSVPFDSPIDSAQQDSRYDTTAMDASLADEKTNHQQAEKGFDPTTVSELVWKRWQASVIRHGLQKEPMGRLAASLKDMTRGIWRIPMSDYSEITLEDLRKKKTHGEKRVHAILEVFYTTHELLSPAPTHEHLTLRILPSRIDRSEKWIEQVKRSHSMPSQHDVFSHFITPLREQLAVDASDQLIRLADDRLGLNGPIVSVRRLAREMGLTRARVYQLLNEIADIMAVRWPQGQNQIDDLNEMLEGLLFETAQEEISPGIIIETSSEFEGLPPNLTSAFDLFFPHGRSDNEKPGSEHAEEKNQHQNELEHFEQVHTPVLHGNRSARVPNAYASPMSGFSEAAPS